MIRLLILLAAGIWLAMANADKFPGSEPAVAEADTTAVEPAAQQDTNVILAAFEPTPVPPLPTNRPRRPSPTSANMVSFLNPVIIGDNGEIIAEPTNTPSIEVAASDVVEDPQINVLYVSASRVNGRGGPSTANAVVGSVEFADAVQVLTDPSQDWVKIRVEGDGVEGFMASRFLTGAAPQN